MTAEAMKLSARLEESWEELLRWTTLNPHTAWSPIAFLAQTLRSELATSPSTTREHLLKLVQAAPDKLHLCNELLEPRFWGDHWRAFVAFVWESACGGDGSNPVETRLGAIELLHDWARPSSGSGELHSELGFLEDFSAQAVLDESPVISNHAGYGVVSLASRARRPPEIQRIARALRRMSVDPRLGVRGAAAYAGARLPLLDVAEEILAVAHDIDQTLSADDYAVIQRARSFGALPPRLTA